MLKLHLFFSLTLLTGIGLASCGLNPYSYQILTPIGEESVSIVVDGENFANNGLITKDGWKLTFHHIYVKVTDFQPVGGGGAVSNRGNTITLLEIPNTVDLISPEVSKLKANANKTDAVVINGLASRGGETIEFTLRFNHDSDYICDRFLDVTNPSVPATRQLEEIETSLKFDRLFGNGNLPASAKVNQRAIGFQPLADLARDHHLDLEEKALKNYLSEKYYGTAAESLTDTGEADISRCNLVNE